MNTKKRHIDYRKVVSVVAFILLIFLSVKTCSFKKSRTLQQVFVTIDKQSTNRYLITKKDVIRTLQEVIGVDPAVASIEQMDLLLMEATLNKNPFIQQAELYVDARLNLHIHVVQRVPLARVKEQDTDYYISSDGVKVPPSMHATVRVPVVTGKVDALNPKNERDVFYYKMTDFLTLINDDVFLKALIGQIHIEHEERIVCIPMIAQERIIIGDLENMEAKLQKLKDFYKYGTDEKGWDNFAYLDLSFKGQIVGGKE